LSTCQQSHFLKDKAFLVGLPPSSFIGPGIPDILAQNDFFRPASSLVLGLGAGGFRFMPWALADALPLAFRPPDFDCPSALDQAGVLYVIGVLHNFLAPKKQLFLRHVAFHPVYYITNELNIPPKIPL
jgi:hypothetical protein